MLDGAGVDYEWIDIDANPAAREEVMRVNGGMRSVPTIVFSDGSVVVEPSRRALLAKLAETGVGRSPDPACDTYPGIPVCDTGPAGRLAFVARELKQILTRRRAGPGNQL